MAAALACGDRTEGSQQTPEAGQESTELTGCYDVTEGEWVVEQTYPGEDAYPVPSEYGYDSVDYQIPPRIRFAGPSDRQPSATRIVVPAGALPTPHRHTFGETVGDSLILHFSTGHVGVRATLARSGTGWSGTARTFVDHTPQQVNARPVELIRMPCDSPPPVSSDVMRAIPRTVATTPPRSAGVQTPDSLVVYEIGEIGEEVPWTCDSGSSLQR